MDSQPSSGVGAAGIVQLARPARQLDVHTLPLQLGLIVPVVEHTRPQPPQFETSSTTLVSQPSSGPGATGSTQFPQPLWQLELHCPPLQLGSSVFVASQLRLQAPQLFASASSSVSRPSSAAGATGVEQSP